MQLITEILTTYSKSQAEINFLLTVGFVLAVAGVALAQRIKGRRIRQAMQEWGDLFTDMNARLATLQRDLMDVRQQLDIARSEATLAKQDSEMHRERNRLLTEDVERLKARVAELEQREKELLAAVQLANDGKAN